MAEMALVTELARSSLEPSVTAPLVLARLPFATFASPFAAFATTTAALSACVATASSYGSSGGSFLSAYPLAVTFS